VKNRLLLGGDSFVAMVQAPDLATLIVHEIPYACANGLCG
jgi:hypothetical protein